MKRQTLIDNFEGQIVNLQNKIEIVSKIPLKKILKIRVKTWDWAIGGTPYIEDFYGIPFLFNKESLRCHVLASDCKGYPLAKLNRRRQKDDNFSIPFDNILDWEVLPAKDLPLCMGCDHTTPLLEKYLAEPPKQTSSKEDLTGKIDSVLKKY